MDEAGFWEIVQRVHDESGGDMDDKCERVRAAVGALPPADARAFAKIFDTLMDRAYTWSLWGAAYVINGGCSDDSFTDFRASLISRGHGAYERALKNPDSLAGESFDDDDWFHEGYAYAVTEGAQDAVHGLVPRSRPHPARPSGKEWSEDEVYDLYPRLAKKFG